MSKKMHAIGALIAWALLLAPLSHAGDLTFEERVRAQEAIERVYYSHQIGATKPFEEAVPRSVLERKVRQYLEQSAALERYWQTRVTADGLLRELERMVAGTRMPERFRELYAALDHDPLLIQECLARPALVSRLVHNFFAKDERIHVDARRDAERLRDELLAGRIDPHLEDPRSASYELVRVAQADVAVEDTWKQSEPFDGMPRVDLDPEAWERARAAIGSIGEIPPVGEDRERFVIRILLEEEPDRLRVASFGVDKTRFEEWWGRVEAELDAMAVPTVASPGARIPTVTFESACLPDDVWDNGSLNDVPSPMARHTAVWTGSAMLVWTGPNSPEGWRYDPAADTWTPISTADAPSPRYYHTAVWTGEEMIVWGGTLIPEDVVLDTGARYDPLTDTWAPTSITNAPTGRHDHTAVWTGAEMIVWGGLDAAFPGSQRLDSGGRYDPQTDTWISTSTTNGPPARNNHTAVWTGGEMIVWGGDVDPRPTAGWRYDPQTDTWTPTSPADAPSGRIFHSAVWTGSEMIVWGGYGGSYLNSGGRYDPGSDTWTPTTATDVPLPRASHSAVWTGSRMIVWGGERDLVTNRGGSYDPQTDSWTPTSTTNAPAGREDHTAVWTGSLMIAWGGRDNVVLINSGGRYDPLTDAWTPTHATSAPLARYQHTTVWTGNRMIVWGGQNGGELDTGGRYDPTTDSWTPVSTTDAPQRRTLHTAVWTGSEMIVWGGWDPVAPAPFWLNSGGRYDPLADAWTPTSMTDVPEARRTHTAVWTGAEIIVWGGQTSTGLTNTGGRYDPATDAWAPTPMTNAPGTRTDYTTVWTGAEMIVWGGWAAGVTNTGSRYDPVTDTWAPTSTTDAPAARLYHTAQSTGSGMIVWSGTDNDGFINTGGLYDPVTDSWAPTTTTDAPPGRLGHTTVWTGSRMIVWGGGNWSGFDQGGGRYDPLTDTWLPTSTVDAALARVDHTAVWANGLMLVWGGRSNFQLDSGGRYALGNSVDDDGDGLSECGGDCNDFDAGSIALPIEVTGLVFANNQQTLVWDSAAPGAGPGTVHDVVRGTLVGFGGEHCLATGILGATATDSDTPAQGGVFSYLVRGRNSCGVGTYGFESGVIERTSAICP